MTKDKEAFVNAYRELCWNYNMFIDTLGFEHSDPVVIMADCITIDQHIESIRDMQDRYDQKWKGDK